MALKDGHCKPARGAEALPASETTRLLQELSGWKAAEDGKWLLKEYRLKDFTAALTLASRIGEIANREDHHPDLELGYGYLRCRLQTHDVGGLHLNDFILAAKIDEIA